MLYIILAITLIFLLYLLFVYNKIVKANNKVKDSFATMDVYLKKRWDLIPNIVECVKSYAKYEKDVLKEVVTLRNNKYESMNSADKINTNYSLADNLNRLMMLSENYPELKASENFQNLSNELTRVEDEIAHSRKYYNATIRDFNNLIETVPNNIVAKIFGYKTKEMFKTASSKRENVKIEL